MIGVAASCRDGNGALAPASAPAQVIGFTSGVTAGEVTEHTAIVWGRTDTPTAVVAQVAKDSRFRNLVRQRSLRSTRADNNTIQTQFDGFAPNTRYHYRFCYPGGEEVQRRGQVQDRPPRHRPEDDSVWLLRRRDRPAGPGERWASLLRRLQGLRDDGR